MTRLILLVSLLLCPPACSGLPGSGDPGVEPLAKRVQIDPSKAWLSKPVAIRFFPATRFTKVGGEPFLDARVELMDEMGDTLKASGEFRFELFAGRGRSGTPDADTRLYLWDVQVMTKDQQQMMWDPVLRAYQFKLRMDDFEPASRPTLLQVTFVPARPAKDHSKLTAVVTIRPE